MGSAQTADASAKPARRANLRRALLLVAFLAGAAVAFLYVTVLPRPEVQPDPDAGPAVPRAVKALGEVLPVTDLVTIAGPTGQDAGRIARIDVAEGDRVEPGQVLAVLDSEPLLLAQLDQAIANEAVSRAALAVRIADLDTQELQIEAQMEAQRVALEKAQLDLDNRRTLRDSGLYDDAALSKLRLDVSSATFALRNLQLQHDRTRLRTADDLRLDQQKALAELAAATAARAKAEADYARAAIRAPIAGRVLALFGRVGQQIDSNGFGEIGDTDRMAIRAEVYETDMVDVSLGQPVTARSRAFTTVLSGSVSRLGVRISGQSILSTDPAAIVDARVIEVWIALDDDSSQAMKNRTGQQVTVAFAPEGEEDA